MRSRITSPGGILPFIVSHYMIAVFGDAKLIAEVALQIGRGLVHGFGVPGRITGEAFVLSAQAVLVPTKHMPGVIGLAHALADFAGGRITGVILFAINKIMDAGLGGGALKVGNGGEVI